MITNLDANIKACQNGKAQAQKLIYEAFAPKMYGICLGYCKERATAEDCLQEGFIKAFTKIELFRFDGSFEGWLRRIMVNTVIEHLRKKRIVTFVDEYPPLRIEYEEQFEEDEYSTEDIMQLMQELPPKYRMVLNLYAVEGYSHQEISSALNISLGTSKSNLSRARQWLKKRMEERIIEKNRAIC